MGLQRYQFYQACRNKKSKKQKKDKGYLNACTEIYRDGGSLELRYTIGR